MRAQDYMVFRLPTHLESFVPPPSEQVVLSRPWRGAFAVNMVDGSAKGISQEVRVTAAETGGDNCTNLWPSQFYIYMTREQSTLPDFQTWVKRHTPPICAFMPDRIQDPNANAANQKNFSSLSRILLLNQMVAIATWGASDRLPGAGIVLYPTQSSSNLLFGAVFLSSQFPDFVIASPTAPFAPLPTFMPSRQPTYPHQSYSPHMGYSSSYASTSHQTLPHASSSHHPMPSPSPTGYRYRMPRLDPGGSLSSAGPSGPSSWSSMTNPDDEGS